MADETQTDREARGTEYGVADPAAPEPTLRPVVLAVAVILPVLLLVGVLVAANRVYDSAGDRQSDDLAAVGLPNPDAQKPECTTLMSALPDALGEAKRVALVDPAPAATAGYRMPDGEPLLVRCGLPAPEGFVVGAALQQVNGVQWFSEQDPVEEVTNTTYVTVDRAVHVAVTLPEKSGTGPIQDLSDTIAKALPAEEPRPAPLR